MKKIFSFILVLGLILGFGVNASAAEKIFEEASTYYNRGLSYYNKGEYDLAIADYNKAIL